MQRVTRSPLFAIVKLVKIFTIFLVFHDSTSRYEGDLIEIAANLFSSLHTMEDDPDIQQIFIQPVSENGLGMAIMDRIRKAAFKYQK